ncbi:zinc transporter ZIP11 isoform X3 [Nothobranchius furzeri]|uniref:zinc transporter ZIP11 isoform X3 n=1 Tax=Nothobranchius furzeri TaxID=105023 RepID=UPI0039048D86
MLEGYSPVTQALLGTLFTWGLTAAGAALVFVFSSRQKRILDGSLGFAAGGVGSDPHTALALPPDSKLAKEKEEQLFRLPGSEGTVIGIVRNILRKWKTTVRTVRVNPQTSAKDLQHHLAADGVTVHRSTIPRTLHKEMLHVRVIQNKIENGEVYKRKRGPNSTQFEEQETGSKQHEAIGPMGSSWRRILLLILAITIHNIPEGLAVGVGFGAIGKTTSATFESARNLAIGIGIQNFPEGLAVSLPLRGSGVSVWKAFWYGQLSGMVEPIAGLLGASAVVLAEPLLPYALAFAAGAMVYVVVDDIIPEAQVSGNGRLASWTSILGFIVMMSLDVGLG